MPTKTKKVGARRTPGMRARASSTRKGARGASARGAKGGVKHAAGAHPIIDHEKIRAWVEDRGGHPAVVVKATRSRRGKVDPGIIRIDVPGYSGARSLEPIDWDEWFEKFDQSGLALMVQDRTARGQKSNFNKLVKRSTAEGRAKGASKGRTRR